MSPTARRPANSPKRGRPKKSPAAWSPGAALEDLQAQADHTGRVHASMRALAARWRWSEATVRRFVNAHVAGGRILRNGRARMDLTRLFDAFARNLTHRPRRPALRYHGGKWLLAPWIIEHFPQHRIYTEVFGGAASVLIRKPRAYREVYNDVENDVVTVFRVLRDPALAQQLERALAATAWARVELRAAYEPTDDPVESARRAILRTFAGMGGNAFRESSVGFRCGSIAGNVNPAGEWPGFSRIVRAFTERLQGVTIENRDAAWVVERFDSPRTLHYVDPPYPSSTRGGRQVYRCEMEDGDPLTPRDSRGHLTHHGLAQVLRAAAGMVIVSGYPCTLYDRDLFPDWTRVERRALADGARERTEVLWLNPAASAASPALSDASVPAAPPSLFDTLTEEAA